MPMTKQQLLAEAMSLDETDREALADQLLSSLSDLTPEQRTELSRRIAALDSGQSNLIDGEQAMHQLLSDLQKPWVTRCDNLHFQI
jgi:hypothetical protein